MRKLKKMPSVQEGALVLLRDYSNAYLLYRIGKGQCEEAFFLRGARRRVINLPASTNLYRSLLGKVESEFVSVFSRSNNPYYSVNGAQIEAIYQVVLQ